MSPHIPSPFRAVAPVQRWAMLAVILLGAFLRIWMLGDLPPGLYHDEAYNGLDALALIKGEEFPIFHEAWELYEQDAFADDRPEPTKSPIFFTGNFGRESLHIYGMAISIQIFGATPFAIRFLPALAGILAIFMTYLAAAAIFDGQRINQIGAGRQESGKGSPVPLLAAFILAILYPAVTFSRFGVRAMLFAPVSAIAVYAFWRGYDRIKSPPDPVPSYSLAWHWFLGAGFAMGMAFSTYAVARLFPFVFVIFVLVWFWRDRQELRQYWRHLLLMGAVALLAALPLLAYFWRFPYFLTIRTSYVASNGLGAIPDRPWLMWIYNVGRVFRGFFWQGETHLRHNLPGRPYLDAIQAIFFVAGWVRWWINRGKLRYQFLLIWFLVMLLPTILSGDAPHFGRLVGAAPVTAIMVGAGIEQVWLWAAARWWSEEAAGSAKARRRQQQQRDRRRLQVGALLTLLLGISTLWTGIDYFVRYAGHPDLETDFYVRDWALGNYVAGLTPPFTAYLTPTQAEMATIFFALEGEQDRLRSFSDGESAVPLGIPGEVLVYLIDPDALTTREALLERFPTISINPLQSGFIPYTLLGSTERIKAANFTDATLGQGITLVAWSTERNGGELAVTLYWQATADLASSYTAYVHLVDDNGTIMGQRDRIPAGYPTQDWREGELITDRFVLTGLETVPEATYLLRTGFYDSEMQQPLAEPLDFATIDWGP